VLYLNSPKENVALRVVQFINFQAPTLGVAQIMVYWIITRCSIMHLLRRFRGT